MENGPGSRSLLPWPAMQRLRREYRGRYGLRTDSIAPDGAVLGLGSTGIRNLPMVKRAREHALQESVRWGEPYTFFLAPGIVSWIVPVVQGSQVRGGLCGGEVRSHDDPLDRDEAIAYLTDDGAPRIAARAYVTGLPIWRQSRTAEAATWLSGRAYELTRWVPELLDRNRENALQQRQIAEEIHRRKTETSLAYSLDQERALLARIRVGDRSGARRELNKLLANVFVHSTRLPLVQARMIELLGYLVRAAVEDNPVLDALVERHIQWIDRIIATKDFESACAALRDALDEFIHHVGLQGFHRRNPHVQRLLQFLAENYTRSIRLDEVAALVGLSRFRLAHLVKDCTGKTVLQHVKRLRVQQARTWLEETDKDFAQIAYDLGFADQSHFTRQFREVTGVTPARYRRNAGPTAAR